MASMAPLPTLSYATSASQNPSLSSFSATSMFPGSKVTPWQRSENKSSKNRPLTVVAAVGDVSSDGTAYLIAGAAAVALIGTAFPIFFSRKDLCPVCDGAGFVRQAGGTLRANAARKDLTQIVCARCNGLGKLNQIDK
ncbi:hypothetical protein Acr_02g0009670 [Actinidia rufa]|uniref:Uncharacterized protein n=1 Tax=Actinidia rufa TaxID=165716 RepID=A0A7J0EAP8_9ERIC|nr:hypothetical protein Acr_02g0009670 [Actinidia rufa]